MAKISSYDKYSYDYSTYWTNRDYEHKAELIALDKLFKDLKGRRIIDIGGSFGRLTPVYSDKFDECVIVDYSLETLKKYKDQILKANPNVQLVAANAYKLPFRQNSFDAALIVRVLHHIEKPEELYRQISRVLSDKATFIHEFANKIHIKARLKWKLEGNKEALDLKPYQQPSQNFEGSKKGTVFLNFHPAYIKELLEECSLHVTQTQALSFFRIPILKKLLPSPILVQLEKLAQSALGNRWFTPSVIFKVENDKSTDRSKTHNLEADFKDILICPKCQGVLKLESEKALCSNPACNTEYKKTDGIWDFRVN